MPNRNRPSPPAIDKILATLIFQSPYFSFLGNAHGHYKKPPKLDIERVRAIRKATGGIPLVLHGGSGIPDDQVRAAIAAGVRKMNIGTDVCCAFADGTQETLNDPARSLAVDLFMKKPIEAVKRLALSKIALTGAEGKA